MSQNKKDFVKPDKLLPVSLPEAPPPPLYTGPLTAAELLADQKKIEDEISKSFPAEFVAMLKKFAYYLSNIGLGFDEACKMVRFTPEGMAAKIKEFPIIQELIDAKELEYKVSLMETVSAGAIANKDVKLAQWLLVKRFPQEFNQKASSLPAGIEPDGLAAVVEFIQKSSDSSPLIKETSGRAFIMQKKESKNDIIKSVADVLS